ncbi:hypothetical protein SO802_032283 [Lithocarpus litseifolius]|uniref:F-box domain-containing protein n=1 Tax=Lithocarpus litseifolius TaxID=425828 RepID=A0AAW2BQ96_9ROSI
MAMTITILSARAGSQSSNSAENTSTTAKAIKWPRPLQYTVQELGAMSDSNQSIRWGCLPDEILSHIFTFLPINSIIICTSVSKTWKSLIKNPTFITTHLHHSHNKIKNNLLLLRLSRIDKQVYTLQNEDDPDFTEYASFDSPFHAPAPHLQHPHHITYTVVGTCNGLLFLSDANEFFLWNPCVRKFLQLPSLNVTFTFDTLGLSHASFGFGFYPKSNDYKWSGFSPCCAVISIMESLDRWSMFTHSPQVNGECLVLLLPCLLYALYLIVSHRHLPMGHCIGLLSLIIPNSFGI